MHSYRLLFAGLFVLVLFSTPGCSDPRSVFDSNAEIPNHNWAYINRVKFDVKIEDETIPYNLYFNLRVSAEYKYANIFILFHQTSPGKKTATTRYEYKLANADGEWLGSGSGNLYSYQVPLRTRFKFPAKGTYHFEIEQNMRDNPLHEVTDAGLRVEKSK